MTHHILLVDDESAITGNLAPFLERSGFSISIANDGEEALAKIAAEPPDLVVLDVLMPKLDGRAVLRRLRGDGNWTPIILLTQVGEAFERAMALEEGADDYLNKPFDPHELVARIKAVLRRSHRDTDGGRIELGGLVLDESSHRVYADDREIPLGPRSRRVFLAQEELTLTPKALALLEYLMTHPDELVSRDRLLDVVWGWDYPVGTRAVDTRIAELRRVLKDDPAEPRYIETIPGQGYRFAADVEGAG